ncbi:MAG: type II toxin-antitoxin system antitoxin SocA domain-containing protein [Candidatus Magasanikbacteria bacterium]
MSKKQLDLRVLRKQFNMSQEDLARRLGMSRPTLMKVEKGERVLSLAERDKVRDIFDLVKDTESVDTNIRISIPQKNLDKFKQVLLYILERVGNKPNVGMTVLYKLLYFIDFDYYEKYEEQLMGLTYIKNHHGPTPKEFIKVVEQMKQVGELEEIKSKYFTYEQKKFLPVMENDLSLISGRELEHIDWELGRLANLSAKQISDLSHIDTPWAVTDDGGQIDYEFVFYRPEETSVREYESL